jgi:PAS domain S-box-containing protein
VFANEALARMSGYSTDELAGMPFRAGAREGRDEIEQRVRRRLAGEDVPSAHEIDLLRKDGKSFTAEASAGVIAYEGAPAELVLLRDVTARKRAEAELRDSEALSRSILSASPDDITTTDLEGRVRTVSPGGVRMFGLESEAAALGHSLGEFVVPEDRQRAAANVALMHQGVSAGPSEYGGLRADGSTFAIEVNGKLIRDVHEQPTGMVFIVRDITARKQTEQLLAVPAEILAILAVSAPLRETVDGIVTVLKRATCLDAVGLRLLEGDDYPFTAAVGYSDDFLQAENSMAVRYPDGGLCRNEDGSVRLECTCGLVLSGDTDPAGSLFTAGGSAFTNDAHPLLGLPPEEDPRLHPRNRCIHAGFLSIALVPLRAGAEILGLLHFADRRKDRFTAESISLLEGVGASIGVALLRKRAEENLARSAAELREQLHDTVKTMGAIVSLRDPYTAAHELRVTELAVAIAHEMGLDEETCEGLAFAGEVHDIGKIGIPAEILSKPGALTAMEYALIKEHPQAGRELLAAIRFRQPVAEIVGQHQERLDGSGYPDGLKGDEIMLEARILAVADVVEAMASHRPYRAALGLEAALAEVRSGAGGRYDAVVVAACERVFAEGFIFSES